MSKNIDLSIKMKMLDKITGPISKMRKGFDGAGTALDKLNAELKNTKAQQGALEKFKKHTMLAGKNKKAINELNLVLKEKGKLTKAQTNRLAKLNEKNAEYTKKLRDQSSQLKKIGISTKNIAKTEKALLNSRTKSIKQITKINEKTKKMLSLRRKLSKVKKGLAIGGAAGVVGGGMAARGMASFFAPAIEFDRIMSRVQAKTNLDKKSPELKKLREQAKDIGAKTTFTASDVAGGQAFLAQAGTFTPEQIRQAMPAMGDLAKAGELDLPTTANIASNIMGSFKISADESRRVADVLATAAVSSNVDLTMLGETMERVAPIANSVGASLETATALIGLLGNIGIQGGQAATTLSNMFARMAAPPKAAKDALEELGISATNLATGELKGMPDILLEVANATKNMGGGVKLGFFKAITGLKAMAGASELVLQAENGKLQKYVESLHNVVGSSNRIAKAIEDNAAGDIEKLKSAWQGLSIESLADSNGALRETIQSISDLINSMTKWAKENPELTAGIIKTLAVVASLAIVIGGAGIALAGLIVPFSMVVTHIGPIIKAFKTLRMLLITNPIIAIIAGIALAAYLIYDNWDGIKAFFVNMWDGVKSMFYSGQIYIIKMLKKVVSYLPESFLPDSLSQENLDKTIAKYEKLANTVKTNDIASKIKDTTNSIQSKIIVDNQPQPDKKSTVEFKVKIDSQTPATVEKVKATGIANAVLDVGNFATAY
jgi:TP901 family phage tail tape measure protein